MSGAIRDVPFIADARNGKRVTRWWLAIILFFVFFVVNIGIIAALAIIWPSAPGSAAAQLQEGIGSALSILVVFAWVGWYERRHVKTLGFRAPGRGVLRLLLGVVIGVVMMAAPILVLWATGAYVSDEPPADATVGWNALPIVLLLLLTVIAQGSNEEILTRGFLVQSLGQRLTLVLVVVIQAVLFTAVHGVLTQPIAFGTIFLFAVFAVFVALREGSLWLVCGIHAGWNWALGNIFGVAVSGLEPKANAFFFLRADESAPEWLTGGQFGTEGSLAALIMIVIATAIAIWLYRRRASTWTATPLVEAAPRQPPLAE
ncbi:CPBP family intramembrane glutamic endopeptidase [Agromyces aerolatus]|uniref:CPBP family intramembrane glutamic endopeptidase n=1 Tax=Agromyces sp. LY-1074 TaxID=3074080 RepID=UPI002865E163|nr:MULTISPECIES: CPBP family glutamic-type intramembrane protease [unclassified Agromyces]MDR5701501.1 CPBP family glutamic-type intramembrane protease [Agromyces sp. LY-1074]MDR5704432.1 CPBP family glutamic-type intramembrane protease [Agromyces sp. LY-1358]